MSVFDDIPRDLTGGKAPDETDFGYLNRSDRVEAARVRALVDEWVSHYPAEHRAALVARLRSSIDEAHESAFFELALHELLRVTGHTILAIEPKLDHTPHSPDFLAATPEGAHFYMEAVTATAKSREQVAADKRLNVAVAAIERVSSPAHFLDLHVEGKPAHPIRLRHLRGRSQRGSTACPTPRRPRTRPPSSTKPTVRSSRLGPSTDDRGASRVAPRLA
ncbi:MAG: hypothetical protein ACOY4G_01875 [Pseudomonadota bacterium]